MKKLLNYLAICIFLIFSLSAEEATAQQMLLSYIENNNDIKNLVINAEKSQLQLNKTRLENGFDITLSTGTINLQSVNGSTTVKASPSVVATIPQASNLSVTANSSVNYNSASGSGLKATDTSIDLSVSVIDSSKLQREINIKKSERELLEAKRALQSQAESVETAFYSEIKSLLDSTLTLLQASQTLYTDTIDFDGIVAKGYSTTSSTYRLAQMKVISDKHTIEEKTRSLIHSYETFYKDCGIPLSIDQNKAAQNLTIFLDLIPSDIPSATPLDITAFNKEDYSSIESANWTYEINSLSRKASGNFSLGLYGGYTFNNSLTGSDSVDAGVTTKFSGVNLSASVNVPVGGASSTPGVTVSAIVTPFSIKKQQITNQISDLDAEKELLAIEAAEKKYDTAVQEYTQKLSDLLWNKQSYEESYSMYSQLEKDLLNWYKAGIIKESEYLSAKSNAQSYKVKLIENQLEIIIYNNTISGMFVE